MMDIYGHDPYYTDDPLGIGLSERARGRRRMLEATEGYRDPINMLRNPRWDAYFQALDEAGVSDLADDSVGMRGRGRRGRATFPPSMAALLNEMRGRSF